LGPQLIASSRQQESEGTQPQKSGGRACFAGWLWVASHARVTMARFEQVQKGMSREEVIRTVGAPPLDLSAHFTHDTAHQSWWACDDAFLCVDFNDTGVAT
jgi:hypothetical protein